MSSTPQIENKEYDEKRIQTQCIQSRRTNVAHIRTCDQTRRNHHFVASTLDTDCVRVRLLVFEGIRLIRKACRHQQEGPRPHANIATDAVWEQPTTISPSLSRIADCVRAVRHPAAFTVSYFCAHEVIGIVRLRVCRCVGRAPLVLRWRSCEFVLQSSFREFR